MYRCQYCLKSYTRQHDLKRHLGEKHVVTPAVAGVQQEPSNTPKKRSVALQKILAMLLQKSARQDEMVDFTQNIEETHGTPATAASGNKRNAAAAGGSNERNAAAGGNKRNAAAHAAAGGNKRNAAAVGGNKRNAAAVGGNKRNAAAVGGNKRNAAAVGGNKRNAAAVGGNKRNDAAATTTTTTTTTTTAAAARKTGGGIQTSHMTSPSESGVKYVHPFAMIVAGCTGSGKTYFVKDMLQSMTITPKPSGVARGGGRGGHGPRAPALEARRGSRIVERGGGDKLAVRSSQVYAPGGSEGMPPRNLWNFRCIFLQFGACFTPKFFFLHIFCR